MAGHLVGGYLTLANALADHIKATGGKVILNTPVEEVHIENGRATAICTKDEFIPYDAVIATLPVPLFRQLIPHAPLEYLEFLDRIRYLGLICPVMVLDRPLTGFWTLNIADDTIPFTGAIETTAYIDPQYVGGYHLVYLPKYTNPNGKWYHKADEEIQCTWIEMLEKMFPQFDRSWIQAFRVNREIWVEPLHPLDSSDQIPPIDIPVEQLFLVTTAQIYPELTNCESITRYARDAANAIISRSIGWENETLEADRMLVV
jgi:protoporphyrinogen oxidase